MDWKVFGSIVAQTLAFALAGGAASFQGNPVAPWQVHAAAAAVAGAGYITGKIQHSPRASKTD